MAASRYDGVEVATATVPDGARGVREVRYLRRRALPDPRALTTLAVHRVAAGDRLDLVAARYLGEPTAAWQVADANAALGLLARPRRRPYRPRARLRLAAGRVVAARAVLPRRDRGDLRPDAAGALRRHRHGDEARARAGRRRVDDHGHRGRRRQP